MGKFVRKNLLFYIYFSLICVNVYAIDFKPIYDKIALSEWEEVLELVDKIKEEKSNSAELNYLKGLAHMRLDEYDSAEEYFEKAVDLKHDSKDLYYEYAQTLYTQNKLLKAMRYFKRSIKNKYKQAVSLYYLAYISQERKDLKKAVRFYKMIEKLPEEETKEVLQPARMQVADIYYGQVQKIPDSFDSIDDYVIPQYQLALEADEESALADDIRQKIFELQRRYDLVLFKMRNGRPTARPPYFLKFNVLYGNDSNVNFLDENSQESLKPGDIASPYTNTGFFGRYTFYPNDIFSVSPELSFSYTNYLSESNEIKTNNNYVMTAGLRVNFEHQIKKKPATTYLGVRMSQSVDDENADDKLEKRDDSWTFSLSEAMNLWGNYTTTVGFDYTNIEAVEETSNRTITSFSLEQLYFVGQTTFFLFASLDTTSFVEEDTFDSTATTLRLDLIFPSFFKLFNPSLYYSQTSTKYPNNSARDSTSKSVFGVNLNRPLTKKLYLTLDYSQESQTGKLSTDEYTKQLILLNLDYIF